MRTQEEILAQYNYNPSRTLFGFDREVLITYLDYDHARKFLKPEVTREQWEENCIDASDRDRIINNMLEYLSFALEKAEDHRAISAVRSVEKLEAWLWMLEDDDGVAYFQRNDTYTNYGAPRLKWVRDKYSPDLPISDALLNMAQGLPCEDGCDEGCGM